MQHDGHARFDREVGEDAGVKYHEHVGVDLVHRFGDRLPRRLAGQAEQARRDAARRGQKRGR